MFTCLHLQVTTQRRSALVAATRRTNITFEHSPPSMYVCPRHFHGRKWYKNKIPQNQSTADDTHII